MTGAVTVRIHEEAAIGGISRRVLAQTLRSLGTRGRTLMPVRKVFTGCFPSRCFHAAHRASEVTNIPEVGAHQPILVVGNDVNPENLIVIYTKVDANGRFLANPADGERPVFDLCCFPSVGIRQPQSRHDKTKVR